MDNYIVHNNHLFHKDLNLVSLYEIYLACTFHIANQLWSKINDTCTVEQVNIFDGQINNNNSITYDLPDDLIFSIMDIEPNQVALVYYTRDLAIPKVIRVTNGFLLVTRGCKSYKDYEESRYVFMKNVLTTTNLKVTYEDKVIKNARLLVINE